jgi:DNA processing protein
MSTFESVTIERDDEAHFPVGLLDLPASAVPERLHAIGNLELLSDLSTSGLVVTGSRASTGYGEHITMQIVSDILHDNPSTIIASGGAYGIEGMAIRAALACESQPVVWLSGGIGVFYPSGHDVLFRRVIEAGGVVVSAHDDNTPPTREQFAQRNEFLGLATYTTLVTEAGYRSGSLVVADAAHAFGRHVYAVPGPITSAASAGCHHLIRQGIAQIATTSVDVIH